MGFSRMISGLVLSLLLIACNTSGTNGGGSVAITEPDQPTPDQSTPVQQGDVTDQEWYSTGQYLYEQDACTFVSSTGDAFPFDCGTVLLGLRREVGPEDIRDLLKRINGTIELNRSGGENGWVAVKVPARTEKEGILESLENPLIRYAVLNFTGPAEVF